MGLQENLVINVFLLHIFWYVQIMKNHVIYYIFLLDTQCTTSYIEKRSAKKANSHFTICSKLTPTHII